MRTVLLTTILLILLPISIALPGADSPRSGFSVTNDITIQDTAVYNTGYISEDAQEWEPFTFTGRQSRGQWEIGPATANPNLQNIRYVAAYSCNWQGEWNCGNTWQVYDREDASQTQSIVENGQATADIVIAADAPNMVQLAGQYFQSDIREMTGATLPIRNTPGNDYDFHVYIGQSEYTDNLGITSQGTRYDGYKILTGDGYLVMLGDDEPYAIQDELSLTEWDALTSPDIWVHSQPARNQENTQYDVYSRDGRGSMNAIHAFLETQGMRYYYPTSFGTITPQRNDIVVEPTNTVVNAAFAMRAPYHYYKRFGSLDNQGHFLPDGSFGTKEEWFRFLMSKGFNHGQGIVLGTVAHGLNEVTEREETLQTHPEYYAVWGGQLMNDGDDQKQNLCSSELKAATVRYASTMIDTYGHLYPEDKYVSVWPADGFTRVSEHSQECRDMATPEYGGAGRISDYVWNFANDVAWEIYDEYGDGHYIMGGAYSAYTLPPRNITNPRGFAPNLAVMISHNRITTANSEQKAYREQLVSEWDEIAPGQVFINDKYLYNVFGGTGQSVPHFFPQTISEDFKFLEGKANGEFDEVATNLPRTHNTHDVYAATGLNMYVTSKAFWDPQLDINELLQEYYTLYYGPAAANMQELIEYSEDNLANELVTDPTHLNTMRTLAEEALAQVPSQSVYAQRIETLLGLMNSKFEGDEVIVQECQTLTSPGTTYVLNQPVSSSGQCFLIDQNGITLDCKEFTIASEGDGVFIDARSTNRGHYATIKNCNINSENGHGIQMGYSEHSTIENNNVEANSRAIWTRRSSQLTIRDNYAYSESSDGAFIHMGGDDGGDRATQNIIENNIFESGSGSGATLYNSEEDVVENNEFRSETANGLRLFNPQNILLRNNIIQTSGEDALYIVGAQNLTQEGNTIIDG